CAPLALAVMLALTVSHARADSDDGIVRVRSAVPMQEAVTRIKADIAAKGIKFFSEIDQSKLASDAGIKLRPSTLLVFGNPPLGTLLIAANPLAGLDWPVRVLVLEAENGQVFAAYTDFSYIARRHDARGVDRGGFGRAAGRSVERRRAGRDPARSRCARGQQDLRAVQCVDCCRVDRRRTAARISRLVPASGNGDRRHCIAAARAGTRADALRRWARGR